MKLKILFLVALGLILVGINPGWAQCPEDTVDRGICDTLYVEAFGGDEPYYGGPGRYYAQVAIYVTHDLLEATDSIGGFVIPLRFTHSNPTAYCSLTSYYNSSTCSPSHPDIDRSVFRHLVDSGTGDTTYNRILQLAEQGSGWDWALSMVRAMTSETDPDSNWFKFFVFPAGIQTPWWWEGEKVLLATMTFKIQDTMTICMDTTFWPPNSLLSFWRQDTKGYTPRTNLPSCFQVHSLYPVCSGRPGDLNDDFKADVTDLIYVINYLFIEGSPPLYRDCADVNCDGVINIADVVCYINYLYKEGPPLRSCMDCYYSK